MRAMRIWQHRLESTASYAAGSDASSLFDKTHPELRQMSNFAAFDLLPIFASPGATAVFSSWQARQPPCFDQTRMTHPFARKAY